MNGLDIHLGLILDIEPILIGSSIPLGYTARKSVMDVRTIDWGKLLFERHVWLCEVSPFLCGIRYLAHVTQSALERLGNMIIHPLDTTEIGLLGIASEAEENEGGKCEDHAHPRGPKGSRSRLEKDDFPEGSMNATEVEGDFGSQEELDEAIEGEWEVDEDDTEDGDHQTLEVAL
jgi:hypothetical protein